MERVRKPFQGVFNIVRFNWHFYILAILFISLLIVIDVVTQDRFALYIQIFLVGLATTITISLAVSFYIYDRSDLYSFKWLDTLRINDGSKIVNINAGFDETSALLKVKSTRADLIVFDFYNPKKHTEVSIKRARKACPPFKNTLSVHTHKLPLQDGAADVVCLILSAHEIRDVKERIAFFKEVNRISSPTGKIIVTEHLRDLPNFLAYNIGCFHFLTKSSWCRTFRQSHLKICNEIKTTPFITTFILEKNGTAS